MPTARRSRGSPPAAAARARRRRCACPAATSASRPARLVPVERGVHERRRRRHARRELVHLVLHERDERREDERRLGAEHRRELVGERLARARRHERERVPALDGRAHDRLLARPERVEPEELAEWGGELGQAGEYRSPGEAARRVGTELSRRVARRLPAGVRVRLEVDLAPAAVRDVRVALGRPQVGVPEHLLDGAEVGAALEQVGGERVAEEVRVDALRARGRPSRRAGAGSGTPPRASAGRRARSGRARAGSGGRGAPGRARGSGAPPPAAGRPSGTRRSLPPLPTTRTIRSSRSTPPFSSPTASETRSPAPYRSSTSARSRSERGVVPSAASISRSVSTGESTRGRRRPRRGSWSEAAGFSSRMPIRTR